MKKILTTKEMAERLGVEEQTVRRWCVAGKIPAEKRPDGKWICSIERFERWQRSLGNDLAKDMNRLERRAVA